MVRVFSLLLLTGGMLPALAEAQTDPPTPPQAPTSQTPVTPASTPANEPRPAGQLKFGPLTFTPNFQIRDLGIDNNVYDAAEDTKSDFTVTPTADGNLSFDTTRLRLEIEASAGYVFYRRYADERGVNSEATGTGQFAFSRHLRIFAGGSYADTRARLNGEIDARARRFLSNSHGGMTIQFGRRLELEGEVGTTKQDLDANASFLGVNLQTTLSRADRVKTARLSYKLTPLTSAGVHVSDRNTRFPFFAVKDENATDVRLELDFKPRAFISGQASLGVRRTRPISQVTPPFTGFVGELLLRRRFGEQTELGLAFGRGTENSFDPTTPYSIQKRVGLQVRRHLFRRAETWLTVDRYVRDYVSFTTATSKPGTDAATRFTAVVSTAITRRARLAWHVDNIGRSSDSSRLRGYRGFRSAFILSYGMFTIGNRSERGGFGPW